MTNVLPLSELFARRLSLDWHEAVAIVRAVNAQLLQGQRHRYHVPELDGIILAADGSIVVGDGDGVVDPVPRLGQLLQALLNDAEVPVQMRLIVAKATAPTPAYESLAEFDQALAYFERPDRAAVLTNLFTRANTAAPATLDNVELTLDRIAPLPLAKVNATTAQKVRGNWRRPAGMTAALIAVAALVAAAALYMRNAGVPVGAGQLSEATVAAADAVGGVVFAGVSAVSDRVGLGRFVAADQDHPPADAATATTVRPTRVASPRAGGKPAANPDGDPRAPVATVYDEPYDMLLDRAAAPELFDARTADPEPSRPATLDRVIYSSPADGVAPPTGLGSQLPRQLPPTVDRAGLTRIELIIARDGSVESARLLGDRSDLRGGMFLSAAKAWQFYPAMKDGRAVRYRKLIVVSFD